MPGMTVKLWVLWMSMIGAALAAERPNIVFFLVDDLGYMDIEPNNPETFYQTPNLVRLAKSGMRFTDAYAANPVCSPTRYSIMTGKYPTRIGATNWFSGRRMGRFANAPLHDVMPLSELTVAEALQEAGYRTAFLGKWHLGSAPEFWPEHQGFEINIGGHGKGSPPGGYFAPYKNPRMTSGPDGEYLTDRLASEAAKILTRFRRDPFLLFLSFHSVHTPLQAPGELVEKYRSKAKGMRGHEFADEEQVWPTDVKRRVRILQKHAVYAAMVEKMDSAVGTVLDQLEALGLSGNTVVFFMSDNGGLSTSEGSPTSNLPYRGGKGWVYEGGIREPCLLRWPGVTPPGSTCATPVTSTDFYPTILEMAGIGLKPAQHLDGLSLVPLLKGGQTLDRRALFWHYPHYSNQGGFPGGAVRMGDWKLIERYEDGRLHLYHLKQDPGERQDLAASEPERVDAMRSRLHDWYWETGARFLRPRKGGATPWHPFAEK